jgi:protein-disulfide isomerase
MSDDLKPRSSGPRLAVLYSVLGGAAAAGAVLLFWQLDLAASQRPQVAATTLTRAQVENAGVSIGSASAPVVLTEFGDFQCAGCAQFSRTVLPPIMKEYVRTGKVRYVYQDYPITAIHQNAVAAARAARCAHEQGRFEAFHDVLLREQYAWGGERDPRGAFTKYASRQGMDTAKFGECLAHPRSAEMVRRSVELAAAAGVRSTPTVFLNGSRIVESPNTVQLRGLIEEELARVGPRGWTGP